MGTAFAFKGTLVTYPQYLRLKTLQERVIRLGQVIRKLEASYPMSKLETMPKWHNLVNMYNNLKGMLPDEEDEQYDPETVDNLMAADGFDQEGNIH